MQFAAEGHFRRAAVQSFFGAHFCHVGVVVYFRKVRENEVARFPVKSFRVAKIFAYGIVREMAGAAHHALLDVPGVWADLEHFEIVIGFEDEAIGAAKMVFHQLGQIAEVGHDGEFLPITAMIRAERKADRVGGVMRNGKRRDFNVADAKAVAGMEMFDVREALVRRFGDRQHRGALGGRSEENRRPPQSQDLRETANVVGVLVRDDDAVEVVNRMAERFEAAKRFALAEAGVHEEAGILRFEQSDIARAA